MKKTHCKICKNKLNDQGERIGLCVNCAEKRYKSVRKILIICLIVGSVLAAVFFMVTYFTQFVDDISTVYIISAVLFFLPFGMGMDAAYLPEMNTGYYEGNAFMSILKWTLCTSLAPIIIIYLLFYTSRLKRYTEESY